MASWEESRRKVGAEWEAQQRQRQLGEQYRRESERMESLSRPDRSAGSSSDGGSSYTGSGGDGASIPTSRIIAILIAVALVVTGVVIAVNYNSYYNGEWTYATADKESSRSVEAYQDYLLSLDTEYNRWHITYEKAPTTLLNYLAGILGLDQSVSYTVGGYSAEGGDVYDYRFEGDDAGTGIPDGWYTLTKLDGINVLIDEDNKTIYKQGTGFYDTYAPRLLALTHDSILSSVLEKASGGTHAMSGSNDFWMEFMQNDNTMVFSYMLPADETRISGDEFRAVTTCPEEQTEERWYFTYGNDEYIPDDWEDFTYADDEAFNTDDALGRLLQESFDDTGSVIFYHNDEAVLQISVEYFHDGYAFEIYAAAEGYERGFEEDMVYRVNTTDKTLTRIENYDYEDEIRTDMPLSAHQDQYDFLLSIVPHTYIRSLIDMDKADVRKESAGLVTVYEMKDENGNVTADMKLMFGVIGEVVHYISETEYVKIELSY